MDKRLLAVVAITVGVFAMSACSSPNPSASQNPDQSTSQASVDAFIQQQQTASKDNIAFLQFQEAMNKSTLGTGLKDVQDTPRERALFESVKGLCSSGTKDGVQSLKDVTTKINDRGSLAVRKAKALQAATEAGAIWEFGCGKGHDADLYTPNVVTG
jgi:hypothetical protein